jgi:glycosyltransferase involved in cell wall biosynthesis
MSKSNNPLISLIVPVYNISKYLERCINSIIEQSYKNIEIILVDDGSTDNSGQICDAYKEHDNRIRVIHKINGGLSSARNAGLAIIKEEYVGFVDGDDFIDKYIYETLVKAILDNDADIVQTGFYHTDENGSVLDADSGSIFNAY